MARHEATGLTIDKFAFMNRFASLGRLRKIYHDDFTFVNMDYGNS